MRLNANGPFPGGAHLNGLYQNMAGSTDSETMRRVNYQGQVTPHQKKKKKERNEGYLRMLAKLCQCASSIYIEVYYLLDNHVSARKKALPLNCSRDFCQVSKPAPYGLTSDMDVMLGIPDPNAQIAQTYNNAGKAAPVPQPGNESSVTHHSLQLFKFIFTHSHTLSMHPPAFRCVSITAESPGMPANPRQVAGLLAFTAVKGAPSI